MLGVDHAWRPDAAWTLRGSLLGSDVREAGQATRGFGATALVDYTMARDWRQQWALMHFDRRLQVNDFGYLARNDFDYLHWQVRKRVTDLPQESRYHSHDWQARIDGMDSAAQGLRLRRRLQLGRSSELRSGGFEEVELSLNTAAWDDLLTRGHGALRLPPWFELDAYHSSPRHGAWAQEWSLRLRGGGLDGNRRLGYELTWRPRYFVSDALSLYLAPRYVATPDWLVWQHDNLVGRFRRRQVQLDAGLDWHIDARQELRLKLQAIGLDARRRDAWRVQGDGRALASDDAVADFALRNLGMQLRYRYELAPLSHLYVVYGRGGYALADHARDPADLLGEAFALRDDEQLLVKFNYRFEL